MGLRVRITVVVTVVFGLTVSLLSLGLLRYVERDLTAWHTGVVERREGDRLLALDAVRLPSATQEMPLGSLRQLLLLVVPLLVLLVAAITWWAVGRTLTPVDAITSRAREITATNLEQRLPVVRQHDEIGRLATTMNAMLARLQAAQDRQRRLTSDASHELRSPVAASISQLEVALAAEPDGVWAGTARTVLREQRQLAHLVEDLLALSRLDERRAVSLRDVDLDDVVLSEASRPHLVLVRPVVREPARVLGDAALLTRAVRNLVGNGARHARNHVRVTVRADDRAASVVVEDDGPGVPMDERERILERFARSDDARERDTGGVGLGLAIVQEVAAVHRGRLTVGDSELGGAMFTLTVSRDGPRGGP